MKPKYKKGDKIYYYLMDSLCQSIIIDFYIKDNKVLYIDKLFNNLKEEYIFNSRKECINFHQNKWNKK
jgi:hypothetical protein